MNPLTLIDGYKLDHRRQYPVGTTRVYSNFTPRGSRIPGQDHVVFLGLQYFLQRYLMEEAAEFFAADVEDICTRYASRVNRYLGPNTIGTDHIRALHALGYMPLIFRALPEGTHVPLRVPMFTVENTHDDFAWLVNYYETLLSACIWMPCTSATSALRLRKILLSYATRTGSPLPFVDWQGHDFSFRGMAGPEAAALSGIGHLLAFTGTDTIPALDLAEDYYDAGPGYLVGGSVAATEHSVMCAGGQTSERETFDRLLALYPSGVVSVVSDTWDLWHVLTTILPELRERIMARDGKLVIRPDSGDPVKIICGDPEAEPGSPAFKGVIQLLWEIFGGTMTAEGYRLLDGHIGCIYGDSISYDRATAILRGLALNGYASGNMVFGVGSFTYQYVTRDTFNFAMKATWAEINGVGCSMFKAPITDDGTKNSARGRLAVLLEADGSLSLRSDASNVEMSASHLRIVWQDGRFWNRQTFAEIRERAQRGIVTP